MKWPLSKWHYLVLFKVFILLLLKCLREMLLNDICQMLANLLLTWFISFCSVKHQQKLVIRHSLWHTRGLAIYYRCCVLFVPFWLSYGWYLIGTDMHLLPTYVLRSRWEHNLTTRFFFLNVFMKESWSLSWNQLWNQYLKFICKKLFA